MTFYEYKVIVKGPTKETAHIEHIISATNYMEAVLRAHEFYDDEGVVEEVECLREITKRKEASDDGEF